MTTTAGAATPAELETRFCALAAAGDLEGLTRLYAADAVVSLPRGREAAGHDAIRTAFAEALTRGAR
jgi:ketosteroid isomerase-like protein